MVVGKDYSSEASVPIPRVQDSVIRTCFLPVDSFPLPFLVTCVLRVVVAASAAVLQLELDAADQACLSVHSSP